MTNPRIKLDEAINRAEHALLQMTAAADEFQRRMDLVEQTSKRNEEAMKELREIARRIADKSGEQQVTTKDTNQPDPIREAATAAVAGSLRRHYKSFVDVYEGVAADVMAAVRPLIEAETRAKVIDEARDAVYDLSTWLNVNDQAMVYKGDALRVLLRVRTAKAGDS